jgi:poly(3-hydroxybutyrate) depolymerase
MPSANGAFEEKHVLFDDPDLGFVDRMYLQYLPSNYQDRDSFPLVIDFHGFSMTANEQRLYSKWDVLAEEEGFIAVFPEGVPDSPSELRGWNINDDTGPYGDVCDRDRHYWGEYECHYSCEDCDPKTSCKEGMTCYNDVAFVEALVEILLDELKVDPARVHITGLSNGAQFSYFLASFSTFKFASFGIVSGVPFLGFGPLPKYKAPIIDFHGVLDDVIPYSTDSEEGSWGQGPDGVVSTVISYDGMYYYEKPEYFQFLADGFGCASGEKWETPMDGVDGWECIKNQCEGDVALVACIGDYGHQYPFDDDVLQGTRIMWGFMKEYSSKE